MESGCSEVALFGIGELQEHGAVMVGEVFFGDKLADFEGGEIGATIGGEAADKVEAGEGTGG
jgi:hypothetical protein